MAKHDKLSVFISLILRHKPETIGIKLDEFGYAKVDELLEGIKQSGREINLEVLQAIVDADKKKRYSFGDNQTLIRANQGHSVPVKVPMEETAPPEFLYHGTSQNSLAAILSTGVKRMNRLYVHLSQDIETAYQVGNRHGEAVILKIQSQAMHNDGHTFYLSENNVWQVDFVPPKYINYGS